MKRRHIIPNDQCRRCCSAVETEDHIFFECPYAKTIWCASGISNLIINSSTSSVEEKIEACLQCSSSTRLTHLQDLPIWLLWRLWKSRNTLLFQQKEIQWRSLLWYAKEDAKEWKQTGDMGADGWNGRMQNLQMDSEIHWKRRETGWIKCNTDGAFDNVENQGKAGWIIRDANGTYLGSAQARGKWSHDALESELQAILMALQHCWSLGYQRIYMESDSQKAIDILNNKRLHFAYYNWKREILWWANKFQGVQFHWTNRKANRVADCLAKRLENGVDFRFHYYVPRYLNALLHGDYVKSI